MILGPFCDHKMTFFCRLPLPRLRACFPLPPPPPPPPPTATKNINIAYGRFYHVYRVSQSASVSSSLPNSATQRRRAKNSILFFKEKKNRIIVYCVLHLSYFVQSIILRYFKKEKKKTKEKLLEVVAGFDPRSSGL